MPRKRKRSSPSEAVDAAVKVKRACYGLESTSHPVLSSYYPRVTSLRKFMLEFPSLSKSRKKKIASLWIRSKPNIAQANLMRLLETTLVGSFGRKLDSRDYLKDYATFSRHWRPSSSNDGRVIRPNSQAEVRHMSIWRAQSSSILGRTPRIKLSTNADRASWSTMPSGYCSINEMKMLIGQSTSCVEATSELPSTRLQT